MTIAELRKKKVLILGLGVNNKHLAGYLDKQNVKYVAISEWKSPEELAQKLFDYEVVFRTPGLPFLSKPIVDAKSKGVVIYSQTKLFFDLCPNPTVGVTGTKGKGTTSTLIARILETAGKKVWLGGNIGLDPFEFLEQISPGDEVILELSSFQLQDLHKSPDIAVVTNISVDHLDHHASFEEYMDAKANILRFQSKQDRAVLNKSLPESFAKIGDGKRVFFDSADAKKYPTRLLGSHNLENVAAAAAVAGILGVSDEHITKAVSEFENLPHHLQIIKEKNGVIFVDDSASTNPDSTIAAIRSFDKNLVLIIGGVDKGVDYKELASEIKNSKHIKGLVIIGQLTDKITNSVKGFKGQILTGATNMTEIIKQAISIAHPQSVILLSPAASSFDMFSNAKDRGEQFSKIVDEN